MNKFQANIYLETFCLPGGPNCRISTTSSFSKQIFFPPYVCALFISWGVNVFTVSFQTEVFKNWIHTKSNLKSNTTLNGHINRKMIFKYKRKIYINNSINKINVFENWNFDILLRESSVFLQCPIWVIAVKPMSN